MGRVTAVNHRYKSNPAVEHVTGPSGKSLLQAIISSLSQHDHLKSSTGIGFQISFPGPNKGKHGISMTHTYISCFS